MLTDLNDVQGWIELVKNHKKSFLNSSKGNNVPPTLFVEREDKVVAILIAPAMDKELLFQAAMICRKGLIAEGFTAIFDAHMATSNVKQETEEEFFSKFPPGSMQKMASEGACDEGVITECLVCHRINKDKQITMITIPYVEKYGIVAWKDAAVTILDEKDGVKLNGTIPAALRKIIEMPSFMEDDKVQIMAKLCHVDPEDQIKFTTRGALGVLASKGFHVADYTGYTELTNV
jgi:hypothetical protein